LFAKKAPPPEQKSCIIVDVGVGNTLTINNSRILLASKNESA